MELAAFLLIILTIWFDGYFDLLCYLFTTACTEFNLAKSVFETFLVVLIAIAICRFHLLLQKKLKKTEKLLPICAHCKCIRNDQGYWKQVDDYISEYWDIEFTHTLCPECASLLYPNEFPSSPSKRSPC
jgi:hypothetical protein